MRSIYLRIAAGIATAFIIIGSCAVTPAKAIPIAIADAEASLHIQALRKNGIPVQEVGGIDLGLPDGLSIRLVTSTPAEVVVTQGSATADLTRTISFNSAEFSPSSLLSVDDRYMLNVHASSSANAVGDHGIADSYNVFVFDWTNDLALVQRLP